MHTNRFVCFDAGIELYIADLKKCIISRWAIEENLIVLLTAKVPRDDYLESCRKDKQNMKRVR